MAMWHAHIVHIAKHKNMVGGPGLGSLGPHSKFGAASSKYNVQVLCFQRASNSNCNA